MDVGGSVGPAPSPVSSQTSVSRPGKSVEAGGTSPAPATPARPAPDSFRRHLPHFEGQRNPIFVTFATKGRWRLPEAARALVLKHILHDHPAKMSLICAVVMPDHAHMLYFPAADGEGNRYTKTEVVGAIKSASAHSINRLLKRKGPVWQDESFDHVTRNSESIEAKAQYVVENPVRRGMCREVDEYPHLWRAWVEGTEEPGTADV